MVTIYIRKVFLFQFNFDLIIVFLPIYIFKILNKAFAIYKYFNTNFF